MAYLWRIPDDYPQSLIGEYEKNNSVDRFIFKRAEKSPVSNDLPVIRFDGASLSQLSKYCCLASNAMVPIVNGVIREKLSMLVTNKIEFCDVIVRAKDGETTEYSFLNVLEKEACIDHKSSQYTLVPGTDQIMGFQSLKFLADCMKVKMLARDEEYMSHLLVSEAVRNELMGMNGVAFYKPDEIDW